MKFYFVPYHIVKDKFRSIIEANKQDFFKHYGEVEVDYEYFDTLSALGMAFVTLAVEDDVVGVALFVVNHSAADKEIEAENACFYINKNRRGQFFGKLLDYSRKEFAKMGVNKITATIKGKALARALRMNNFTKQCETWELICE